MSHVTITEEEVKAIRSLKRLAKKWPKSLRLFSWSGSLVVTKANNYNLQAIVTGIEGIPNDAGDPTPNDGSDGDDGQNLDPHPDVIWPT
jgi:hypothetical protein